MKYPQIVTYEYEDGNVDHMKHPEWASQKANQIKGVVKNNDWFVRPGDAWKLHFVNDGTIIVEHGLGRGDYSVSLSAIKEPCAIKDLTLDFTQFSFKMYDTENECIKSDFAFCVSLMTKVLTGQG